MPLPIKDLPIKDVPIKGASIKYLRIKDALHNKNSCPICEIPKEERVKEEGAIIAGDALKENVATLHGVSVDVVDQHMAEHRVEPQEYAEKRTWLFGKAIQLSQLIDQLFISTNLAPSEIKALVSAMAELRLEIRTLAEIEGELQRKPNVTVQHFNSLKMIVFNCLCPECQKKVVSQLKQIETSLI